MSILKNKDYILKEVDDVGPKYCIIRDSVLQLPILGVSTVLNQEILCKNQSDYLYFGQWDIDDIAGRSANSVCNYLTFRTIEKAESAYQQFLNQKESKEKYDTPSVIVKNLN